MPGRRAASLPFPLPSPMRESREEDQNLDSYVPSTGQVLSLQLKLDPSSSLDAL